jgi:pyruvate/2-oxoglutarate dehydrogenase complex dihydrolipoamide acyltransferase (E2) component
LVKEGEPLVEIETDKAIQELESPVEGILSEIYAESNCTVALGEDLGAIRPVK